MKKTYIQPATLITRLAIQKMICLSDPAAVINTSGSVSADKIESRRYSLWDEDEEVEE